jgi:predicted ribosome-associated RNA-binding protein Tma20
LILSDIAEYQRALVAIDADGCHVRIEAARDECLARAAAHVQNASMLRSNRGHAAAPIHRIGGDLQLEHVICADVHACTFPSPQESTRDD